VIDAALIVALANAPADRRPTRAGSAVRHDALADAASASELLKPFLDDSLDAQGLVAVRALKRAVIPIVDALIDGPQPPLKALNALVARKPVIYALERWRGLVLARLRRSEFFLLCFSGVKCRVAKRVPATGGCHRVMVNKRGAKGSVQQTPVTPTDQPGKTPADMPMDSCPRRR
jgi:hypothetical protein